MRYEHIEHDYAAIMRAHGVRNATLPHVGTDRCDGDELVREVSAQARNAVRTTMAKDYRLWEMVNRIWGRIESGPGALAEERTRIHMLRYDE